MKSKTTLRYLFFLLVSTLSTLYAKAQSESPKKNIGKIYFSTKPFTSSNSGAVTKFSSVDFIYARLETDNGRMLNEILEVESSKKESRFEHWILFYKVRIYKNKKLIAVNDRNNYWHLTDIKWNINALNFDVLPSPEQFSTKITSDEYYSVNSTVSSTAPLYSMISQENFPENGVYTIQIEIYDYTTDDWGNKDDTSKWPSFKGEFEFIFNSSDVKNLRKNQQTLNDAMLQQKDNAANLKQKELRDKTLEQLRQRIEDETETKSMPEAWSAKNYPIGAGFTKKNVEKFFLDNVTFGKRIVKIYSGSNDGWRIEKNSFGIPRYKFLDQEIKVFFSVKDERCGYHGITIRQDYLGGGSYGKAYMSLVSETLLPCSKMK